MRCLSCDCALTDFESTRKSLVSGDFLDLCGSCFSDISDLLDTTENFLFFDTTLDGSEGSGSSEPSVHPSNYTEGERDED